MTDEDVLIFVPDGATLYAKRCGHCLRHFDTLRKHAIYCSDSCRATASYDRNKKVHDRGRHVCRGCGKIFTIEPRQDPRREYCSRACGSKRAKRIHALAADARKRGATIVETFDPWEVFRRANWHCQECDVATPSKLLGTQEPNAPQCSFIDPSKHSLTNSRCLCNRCRRSLGRTRGKASVAQKLPIGGDEMQTLPAARCCDGSGSG